MVIGHSFVHSDDRKIGLLLPLGEYRHRQLLDYDLGTIVTDLEGREGKIIGMTTIFRESELADCLSKQLYGRPINSVLRKMEEKWEIKDEKMLYLVVELV